MIDIRKLKELVRLMVENDLSELDLRDSEEQVTVRRGPGSPGGGAPLVAGHPALTHSAMTSPPMAAQGGGGAVAGAGAVPAATEADETSGLIRIESPMVGTFYTAANPDAPAFAAVGTVVTPDKVVCIIEAMKIFNEIKAECAGTIQKVLVKNGEAVEFGHTLFLVKPG